MPEPSSSNNNILATNDTDLSRIETGKRSFVCTLRRGEERLTESLDGSARRENAAVQDKGRCTFRTRRRSDRSNSRRENSLNKTVCRARSSRSRAHDRLPVRKVAPRAEACRPNRSKQSCDRSHRRHQGPSQWLLLYESPSVFPQPL